MFLKNKRSQKIIKRAKKDFEMKGDKNVVI